jgi:hypothetical protein
MAATAWQAAGAAGIYADAAALLDGIDASAIGRVAAVMVGTTRSG